MGRMFIIENFANRIEFLGISEGGSLQCLAHAGPGEAVLCGTNSAWKEIIIKKQLLREKASCFSSPQEAWYSFEMCYQTGLFKSNCYVGGGGWGGEGRRDLSNFSSVQIAFCPWGYQYTFWEFIFPFPFLLLFMSPVFVIRNFSVGRTFDHLARSARLWLPFHVRLFSATENYGYNFMKVTGVTI